MSLSTILQKVSANVVIVSENQEIIFRSKELSEDSDIYLRYFDVTLKKTNSDSPLNKDNVSKCVYYFAGKYSTGSNSNTMILPLNTTAELGNDYVKLFFNYNEVYFGSKERKAVGTIYAVSILNIVDEDLINKLNIEEKKKKERR